jgi:hypothetical protein
VSDTRRSQLGVLLLAAYLMAHEVYEVLLFWRAHGSAQGKRFGRAGGAGDGDNGSVARAFVWSLNNRWAWLSYASVVGGLVASVLLLGAADRDEMRERSVTCVLLSVSTLCAWILVTLEAVVWHEQAGGDSSAAIERHTPRPFFSPRLRAAQVGIFAVVIGKMLSRDVTKFMLIYVPLLAGFGAAINALFPVDPTGDDARIGSIWSAIENLELDHPS